MHLDIGLKKSHLLMSRLTVGVGRGLYISNAISQHHD